MRLVFREPVLLAVRANSVKEGGGVGRKTQKPTRDICPCGFSLFFSKLFFTVPSVIDGRLREISTILLLHDMENYVKKNHKFFVFVFIVHRHGIGSHAAGSIFSPFPKKTSKKI
jgi:hypothetical protein